MRRSSSYFEEDEENHADGKELNGLNVMNKDGSETISRDDPYQSQAQYQYTENEDNASSARENILSSCIFMSNLPRHGSLGYHNDPTKDWLDVTVLEHESVISFNKGLTDSHTQQLSPQSPVQDQESEQQDQHPANDTEEKADGPTNSNVVNSSSSYVKHTKKFRSVEDIHCVPGHRTSLCRSIQIDSDTGNELNSLGKRSGWNSMGSASSGSIIGPANTMSVSVNGKKVRYKNDGQFHIRVDGELYGPFYRIRVSPYTFSTQLGGQNITFPIASFTTPTQ